MKKFLASLLVLSFASATMAATTKTEELVKKWTSPVVQKETQLRKQHEDAVKAQKAKQEAAKKAQAEQKKAYEAKKAANQKKLQDKKENLNNLLKW